MIDRLKVAGAPITWGVSEVPGWGYRMAPTRVLAEMRQVGLAATELGPPGYLPGDPGELRATLDAAGLRLAAGFLALVLHEPGQRNAALAKIRTQAAALAAAGADTLVLAAAFRADGYDRHGPIDKAAWAALAETLRAAEEIAGENGLSLAFHPHAGTAVEKSEEVSILLEKTNVALCLDTGHLYLAGADVAQLARDAGARVRHVHLKDVNAQLAERVRSGDVTYAAAVRAGLYRPLGQGDLDLRAVLDELRSADYGGWYVLEQDAALDSEPAPGAGPVRSAGQSLEFFRELNGVEHMKQEETA
jgi:inosose dehydratase